MVSYFFIGNVDYSRYVSQLKISEAANYNSQTNAAGDTVVDYINHKRVVEVEIIPLDDEAMINLQDDIAKFNVSISFIDHKRGSMVEDMNCILPENEIEYYTIRSDKKMFKAFTLKFIEL